MKYELSMILIATMVAMFLMFYGEFRAGGQTIPQPDAEYVLVTQVFLPIVRGGE